MSNPKAVDTTEARVQHEGIDPLTAGERLHNSSNSSDAESYEVSNNEVDALKPKNLGGQAEHSPLPVMPAHKTPNKSKLAQDEVAAGRKEK